MHIAFYLLFYRKNLLFLVIYDKIEALLAVSFLSEDMPNVSMNAISR